ncbi:hypothetical protein [Bradyrhizobium japonicum]|uniref:hypothetical protein n=1 Tax=Bradyrhizobium japonicum TaxID=375 RepID=UPI001BABC7DF|nr:hypothetical protein [Bradyrhizobium japonicum]MBR0916523.1 hypothetical protein [Bradyrhizobium japonicum]
MGWSCGFYPGIEPGQHRSGIIATFKEASDAFQRAWQELAASCTEADYEAWREQRDWTTWKHRMHDRALPLPTQRSEGAARCFCGAVITNPSLVSHIRAAHRLNSSSGGAS